MRLYIMLLEIFYVALAFSEVLYHKDYQGGIFWVVLGILMWLVFGEQV